MISTNTIGVFVLVLLLTFYYAIILLSSLAFFFPVNTEQLPTILEMGKTNHLPLHFPAYQFAENVVRKTLEMAFARPYI